MIERAGTKVLGLCGFSIQPEAGGQLGVVASDRVLGGGSLGPLVALLLGPSMRIHAATSHPSSEASSGGWLGAIYVYSNLDLCIYIYVSHIY